VRDPPKGRVVVETRVEDLVNDFLRLLSADFPHGQNGAQGTASDTLLTEGNGQVRCWTGAAGLKTKEQLSAKLKHLLMLL